jgi:hypothetical protein
MARRATLRIVLISVAVLGMNIIAPSLSGAEVGTGLKPSVDEGPRAASEAQLCANDLATRVNYLLVKRTRPDNPERFAFPSTVRSVRLPDIQAAARALCALPRVPRNKPFLCAFDNGFHYVLSFSYTPPQGSTGTSITARIVDFDPTGCRFVTGLGSERRKATIAIFATLGSAMGLPNATPAEFAGTISGS